MKFKYLVKYCVFDKFSIELKLVEKCNKKQVPTLSHLLKIKFDKIKNIKKKKGRRN